MGHKYTRHREPLAAVDKTVKIILPNNEFDIYLAEHPELKQVGDAVGWNINTRYEQAQPKTKEDYERIFSQAVEYIERSALPRLWKYILHRGLLRDYLLPLAVNDVLDFGCGAGNDGLFYANMGFDVTFTDVEGVCLDFVRWRLARRGLPVKVVPSTTDFGVDTFDFIMAIDVFEHLFDAHNYFARLNAALRSGGLLYLSFQSEEQGMDCYSNENFNKYIMPDLMTQYEQMYGPVYRKR